MQENYITTYLSPIGLLEISGSEVEINSILYIEKKNETGKIIPQLFHDCVLQLDEYFRGKRRQFTIPFKQTGTAFQQNVWNELEKIPFGKSVSYLELAKRLGNENLIRAVGNANGKNKMNIIVPCHRVIGHDGKLVGYGGGLWRKKWLLIHELSLTSSIAHDLFNLNEGSN